MVKLHIMPEATGGNGRRTLCFAIPPPDLVPKAVAGRVRCDKTEYHNGKHEATRKYDFGRGEVRIKWRG